MLFADEAVGALLALGGKVPVGQMVLVEAVVVANVGGDRKRQTREAAFVDFVSLVLPIFGPEDIS